MLKILRGRGDPFGVLVFYNKRKPAEIQRVNSLLSGERGIRTPGGVTLNGFQDRRNRPLCHLSKRVSLFLSAKLGTLFDMTKCFVNFFFTFVVIGLKIYLRELCHSTFGLYAHIPEIPCPTQQIAVSG